MKEELCIVLIPALNEEASIGDVISRVPKRLFDDSVIVKVLLVDDGSTDETAHIAAEKGAIVVSNGCNRGVGYSFARGVEQALLLRANYMVNIDADGQMNPEDIEKVLEPVFKGDADMVTASRFCSEEVMPVMPPIKRWGNKKVAEIVSFLCGNKYYDVSCGFRAYNKEVLLRLHLTGAYTYTQESFINLAMKNIRILEVPVKIRGVRQYGKSRVASSVLKYAVKSWSIIFRSIKTYRPKLLFGTGALLTFLVGFCFEILFLIHYLETGVFSGYLFLGITGGFLFLVALFCVLFMFIADSFTRMILNQEEILYYEKGRKYYID